MSRTMPKLIKTFKISKVLKQLHPELKISSNAKSQLNYLLSLISVKLILEAVNLLKNKKTISSREIQTAVRIVFGDTKLKTQAVNEATKSVVRFLNYKTNVNIDRTKKTTKTTKAGLVFSSAEKMIRDNFKGKVSEGSSIYLTAVLEYVCAEFLELAGYQTRFENKHIIIIQPKHIKLAIENDSELEYLVKAVDFNVLL